MTFDKPPLDIQQCEEFETRWRVVERITFAVLVLLVILSALNLLGGKKITQHIPGLPITITYDKFIRYFGASRIKLVIDGPFDADTLHVALGNDFLNSIDISDVIPRAAAENVSREGTRYAFALKPEHRGQIIFDIKATRAGFVPLNIEVEGHHMTLEQFVYP